MEEPSPWPPTTTFLNIPEKLLQKEMLVVVVLPVVFGFLERLENILFDDIGDPWVIPLKFRLGTLLFFEFKLISRTSLFFKVSLILDLSNKASLL